MIEDAIASLIFVGLVVVYSLDASEHIVARKHLKLKLGDDKINIEDKKRLMVNRCILCGDIALILEIIAVFQIFILPHLGIGYMFMEDIYFCICALIVLVSSELLIAHLYRCLNRSITWHE